MVRVADSWVSDMGAILSQVCQVFVNFILFRRELWKSSIIAHSHWIYRYQQQDIGSKKIQFNTHCMTIDIKEDLIFCKILRSVETNPYRFLQIIWLRNKK